MNLENEYIAINDLNSKSPLFARIAFDMINNGEIENAISILEKGIELFENYPTPYFILGKAFLKTGREADAADLFQKGNSLLNDSSNHKFYSNLISRNKEVENKSDELEELEVVLKKAKIEVNLDEDIQTFELNETIENDDFKPPKGLVSETLASIYFDQSNYKEAKAIYETLIEIQPERADYFQSKILQIESRMRTQ
jgi:tetratricopeptide (TPR) repeat protein